MDIKDLGGLPIYIGDSRNLAKRIFYNHCKGNVEASALRKYIAIEMNFQFRIERRKSGSRRIRVRSPVNGEEIISHYIESGSWKYVVCRTYDEANDFQWYAIDIIKPLLNRRSREWRRDKTGHYNFLLEKLISQESIKCNAGDNLRRLYKPGVYLFLHSVTPRDFYIY